MRLIKAIFGIFSTILNIVTLGFVDLRGYLINNPTGVRAEFTAIIDEKRKRANVVLKSTQSLYGSVEKKKDTVKQLSEDVEQLRKKQNGAVNLMQKIISEIGQDAAQEDKKFQSLRATYKDLGSTIQEKEEHIEEIAAAAA